MASNTNLYITTFILLLILATSLQSSSNLRAQQTEHDKRRELYLVTVPTIFNINHDHINKLYKPFKEWDRKIHPFPCVSPDSPSNQGIMYIKVPKTSSTTLAKITSRIAGREARRIHLGYDTCKVHDPMVHHSALELNCNKRDKILSFLWSVVRHPSDRAVSHYGMRMKRGELEKSDDKFIDFLEKNEFPPNVQLQYLSTEYVPKDIDDNKSEDIVKSIMESFNFIGVYERLHESLVVLSMLIGVDLSDILFDFVPSSNGRCGSLIKPSWLTPKMESYLESPSWKAKEKGDFMLYDAVNKSLDLTIDLLGRERVKQNLKTYNMIINIGTDISIQDVNMTGCGIIGLHPKVRPYDNLKDLPWFKKLLPHDQEYIKKYA